MQIKEVIDFCIQREVSLYTTYDFITDSIIIVMRKNGHKAKISVSRDMALSAGFGLTLRIFLRNMADKLDKEGTT